MPGDYNLETIDATVRPGSMARIGFSCPARFADNTIDPGSGEGLVQRVAGDP